MTDTTLAAGSVAHDDHGEHAHHPTDTDYVKIAVGLAVLTAIEVAMSYIKGLHGLGLVIPLMIVMAIKFVIVAGQFMHLKFDNRLLTRVFYAGLILACGVYLAALLTFHTFSKDRCPDGSRAGAAVRSTCPAR